MLTVNGRKSLNTKPQVMIQGVGLELDAGPERMSNIGRTRSDCFT